MKTLGNVCFALSVGWLLALALHHLALSVMPLLPSTDGLRWFAGLPLPAVPAGSGWLGMWPLALGFIGAVSGIILSTFFGRSEKKESEA